MKILGISRSPKFSPNSVSRDEAIFMAVASRLQRMHHDVSIISEDLFVDADLTEFDLVFSMARGTDVLTELAHAAEGGSIVVVNDPMALLHSNRGVLAKTLAKAGVPLPAHRTLHTAAECDADEFAFPLWLKRTDACAQTADDVVFVANAEQMRTALQQFHARGIEEVLAEKHEEGNLVKFYGVEGHPFFFTARSTADTFSKFGLEQHNYTDQQYAFDEPALKLSADRAARATGLTIYGGDAVIHADGTFCIIDFNDWPSFSACRKSAARAIAERLTDVTQ